jgi:hypothetical protein
MGSQQGAGVGDPSDRREKVEREPHHEAADQDAPRDAHSPPTEARDPVDGQVEEGHQAGQATKGPEPPGERGGFRQEGQGRAGLEDRGPGTLLPGPRRLLLRTDPAHVLVAAEGGQGLERLRPDGGREGDRTEPRGRVSPIPTQLSNGRRAAGRPHEDGRSSRARGGG